MSQHPVERPAGALARGPAKSDDIESARRALIRAERLAASTLRAVATRQQREAARHERLARRAGHAT